ncbi:MAG: excinuclease ABC subunit UvrA [Clostridia bacterium]|nr:excinuclease ABC subunit UvrA [Clostridia bacterium]
MSVTIPRDKLVVFTGLSGSGKSTLAFDTIFAEGQRRYMESLSSYARQFLGQMEKPDVDSIEGLSPAISIDQKTTSNNPRSTVGTVTEIYDYLRLLYSRVGTPYCPECGTFIKKQSIDEIVEKVLSFEEGSKILIIAPVAKGKKGEFEKLFDSLRKSGYARVKVDGEIKDLSDKFKLEKNVKHDISVVVDRLIVKDGIRKRLTDSIESAIKLAEGIVVIDKNGEEILFSTKYSCPECGTAILEIEPRLFSFNNPYGACPDCKGLGFKQSVDPKLVIGNPEKSLNEGALTIMGWNLDTSRMTSMYFKALSEYYGFSMDTPIKDLSSEVLNILLYGNGGEKIKMKYATKTFTGNFESSYEGVIPNLERRYQETTSDYTKSEIEKYMFTLPCKTCNGNRLRKEALAVKIGGLSINELCDKNVENIYNFIENLKLQSSKAVIAKGIVKEIKERLNFLREVGLNYLTLSRKAGSLSGGEAQRIRLATQIGSGLSGVLYILDEPSIGLHQRDNLKLIGALKKLRDLGNTLIVVEHDEDMIKSADYIVDIGPKAGIHGGEVVVSGTLNEVMNNKNSITGDYLSKRKEIGVPPFRIKGDGRFLTIKGAKQNNLKNIDVSFPVGLITAVTGVSGSGKSSLVNEILYPSVAVRLNGAKLRQGDYDDILGLENFDNTIAIDQSPIGRSPRSNPATYTGVFTYIRELFASTQDAKERGYSAGRFSFNVSGGRCEHCSGDGIITISMHFLPDVFVPCEVCKGKRYNHETLQVKYKGKDISDVLDMTVDEAIEFFANVPRIYNKIKRLQEVGLGYIKLGQPATTLSGGEAQRVKLATELSKRSTGRTLYILDEPTTGLHTHDVSKLINILYKLRESGNTVIVIEHNLDVIKIADYIVDLGLEGGDSGGSVVAMGTPEEVANSNKGYTSKFLKEVLNNNK